MHTGYQSLAPRILSGFLISIFLSACGGGSDSDSFIDVTSPTPSFSQTDVLGIREPLVVTFNEPMDPSSLTLGGDLIDYSDGGAWNAGNTKLTISPDALGAWESGNRTFTIEVADIAGNGVSRSFTFGIDFNLSTFQAASVVIGQPDFTSNSSNQGGSVAADTLSYPYGATKLVDDVLWVSDGQNARVLGYAGIPTSNNTSASYVVGQGTFTSNAFGTTDSALSFPQQFVGQNGLYYVLENGNNRVLIYNTPPYNSPPVSATGVLGQADFTSSAFACGASAMNVPESMIAVDGKLLVADGGNHRVLIWSTLPRTTGTAPDLVLGQADLTHCTRNDDNQDNADDGAPTARTINYASGVWSDGTRVAVLDQSNHRVLIWNSFPTSNFQPADVVLGQSDFVHSAYNDDNQDGVADGAPSGRTLFRPYGGVWSNGRQLFVVDSGNYRVLVWNSFPTSNFQPADIVIGQGSFTLNTFNDDNQDGIGDAGPTARTLYFPVGVSLERDKLFIADNSNHRVLIYDAN